jgi:hypothetical protein
MLTRPPFDADRKREHHRERQRRYRRRERKGHISVTLIITPEETDRLCRLHYLTDCELEDRRRIAEAFHAVLADVIIDG